MPRPVFILVDLDERWYPLVQPLRQRGLDILSIQSQWRVQLDSLWNDIADQCIIIEDASVETFSKKFSRITESAQIVGLLSDQDAVIASLAAAAQIHGISFSNPAAVDICRNKGSFRQFLARLGDRRLDFRIIQSLTDVRRAAHEIGFPCVLKPVCGSGSRICYPLHDWNHVDWYLAEYERLSSLAPKHMNWLFESGLICEKWLDGPIASAAVAVSPTGVEVISCALHLKHDENPCVGFGSLSFPTDITGPLSGCAVYAAHVVEHLKLGLGLFDIEMVVTPSGPIALEVNARPMGGEMVASLAMRTTNDVYGYIIDLYLGLTPKAPVLESELQSGVYKIVARTDGKISAHFTLEALQEMLPLGVVLRNYRLNPGARVHALEVLARVLFVSADLPDEIERIDRAMSAVSTLADVEMVTASPSIAEQVACVAGWKRPPVNGTNAIIRRP